MINIMFFFFKSKSKKKRERNKNKFSSKKTKKNEISRQQMEAICDSIIAKKRLVVYAESL